MTHKLKTVNPYFKALWDGTKKFEIRKNDRLFKEGDCVELLEYDATCDMYSGRSVTAIIGYVTSYNQKDDYVVFSLLGMEKIKACNND